MAYEIIQHLNSPTFCRVNLTGCFPKITKVIYNYPATIAFFDDGTKTVVKHNEPDDYDHEKGALLCMAKKIYGKGYYKNLKKVVEDAMHED